jgi:peroxiredoxin
MTALTTGTSAPTFSLKTIRGESFSLRVALKNGPVILAFFKISCPVCQFAFPYLERIYKIHGGKRVSIIGISQNDAKDTEKFLKHFGLTFPVLLDDTKTYPVSNAYGLTNVPTIFWIADDGRIEISSVGWVKQEMEEIHHKAAEANSAVPAALFRPDEKIAEFRAG